MYITEANTDTERKTISPYHLKSSDNRDVNSQFGSTDQSITEPAASSSTLEVWNGRYSKVHNVLGLLQMSPGESASIGNDRISLLPDSLQCHILSFLTTKEAVCASVLSSRWRDHWKWLPRLDLKSYHFPNDQVCVDFINKHLLNFNSLSEFKLNVFDQDEQEDNSIYERCLDKLTKRKIQHLQVQCYRDMEIPLTLPMCETLISLNLFSVRLNSFESISLPHLRVMYLEYVVLPRNAVLDTPRLQHLSLSGYLFESFIMIKRMSDHVTVDIDVGFEMTDYDDLSATNVIYNLLNIFSNVGDMTLSQTTLAIIYCLRDMNPLPKFRDLAHLRATMCLEYSLDLLPFVLESFPNMRHLTLKLVKNDDLELEANSLSKVLSFCLASSLENVDIESPITEEETEQEVVRYFLGNATSLKKLVLRLNVSDRESHDLQVLKQRFDSPRRSSLCQFDVLLVLQTP